jgi:hypothetical protein
MNEIRIVIPDVPKSMNIYAGRNVRWNFRKDKEEWHSKLKAELHKKPGKPFDKAVVLIHYDFTDNRRRDRDNYSGKFLMDPLVEEGILVDDSFQHVPFSLVTASFRQPKKQTIITVLEVVECQTGS